MLFPIHKQIRKVGGSYTVILPKAWIDIRRLEEKDIVKINIDENYNLIIKPVVKRGDEYIEKISNLPQRNSAEVV